MRMKNWIATLPLLLVLPACGELGVPTEPALLASADVLAPDFSECQAQLTDLAAATAAASFTGRNADKDRNGMLQKLDEASQKLTLNKPGDAVQKLGDFNTRASNSAAQGKLDPGDAAALIAGADAVIACIGAAAGW